MFTFQYSIPTLEDTSTFIHRIRPSAASEEKGPIDVLSIYLPRFKENFENGGKVIQINTKYKESNIAEVFKKSAKTL